VVTLGSLLFVVGGLGGARLILERILTADAVDRLVAERRR